MNNPETFQIEEARWRDSALVYANITPLIPCYIKSSQKLVHSAAIAPLMTLVDLGCGSSGLVINEILRLEPNVQRIYAVDVSRTMLDILSTRIRNDKIVLIHTPAEKFVTLLEEKVDRILSNAAIWLFSLKESLVGIQQALKPSGKFVFNIADWDIRTEQTSVHPRYIAIDGELARRGQPPKPNRGSARKYSIEELTLILTTSGLRILEVESFRVRMAAEDWKLFYSIPAIASRSLPNLALGDALATLQAAMERLETESDSELPDMGWVNFVCEPLPK